MTEPALPRISRRPALPLIWIVPLVALVIAAWMVVRQYRDRGPEIVVEFATGGGVEAGKTELEHKGVTVGLVKHVALKPDLSGVEVRVRLTKAGAGLARAGARFWVVRPEVGLSGIRGIETLVSGVRLNVRPGGGEPATRFKGLDRPPPIEDPAAGRAFVLRAEKLGGLVPGSPVYFRGVKVGAVETTWLAENASAALVRVRIYTPYVDLVRTNTQFWNASGIAFKFGLSGAEIRTTTLQSIFAGGVSFSTPTDFGAPALEGTEYVLHAEPDKAWAAWNPRIQVAPVESAPDARKPEASAEAMPPLTPAS